MDLNFEITYQKLTRKDNSFVVSHSQNYLYAVFNYISDDWKNDVNKKYAIFQDTSSNDSYTVEISNDECIVPAEVLKNNSFYVSVIGTNDSSKVIVTTNKIYITLNNGAELSELYPEDPEMPLIPSILERLDKTFIDLSYSFDKESKTLTTMITLNDKANNKITRNVIINLDDNDRYIENISMDWEHKQLVFTFNDKKVINVPFNIDYSYIENTPTKLSEFTNDENFVKQTDLTKTLEDYAQKSELPTKTSDLTNDSGFITKLVEDLVNYYKKSETYNKEEIDQRISAIPKFNVKVVVSLPISNISTTTLYLLKTGDESQNLYTEFIYVDGVWERLGTQTLDLSGYATQEWVISKNYLTKENLSGYATEDWVSSKNYITSESLNGYATEEWVNNKNYATKAELPTKVSQLVNDSNYQNEEQVKKLIEDSDQIMNVDIDCDHEYEITGKTGHEYGVAIEDSQMLLKKIQGQTRRYSLNLFNPTNVKITGDSGISATTENNILVLNGTANDNVYINCSVNIPAGTYSFGFTSNSPVDIYVQYDGTDYTDSHRVYKNNPTAYQRLGIVFDKPITNILVTAGTGDSFDNQKIYFQLNEGSTLEPFQPYDDTLVNSKCNLISTGRNLINLSSSTGTSALGAVSYTTFASGEIVLKSLKATSINGERIYIKLGTKIPAGKYTLSIFNTNTINNDETYIQFYYDDDTYTGTDGKYSGPTYFLTNNSTGKVELKYPTSQLDIKFGNSVTINGTLLIKPMLVYGDTASTEYEPYTQEELPINVELGAYDYIDNVSHSIVKQASSVITLDGSVDEEYVCNADSGYISYDTKIKLANGGVSNKLTYDYTSIINNFGTFWVTADTRIIFGVKNSDITSVEAWKTYLQSNPIQVVAKLATPTTEQLLLPAGYAVYTGGLQQQVIDGKYLPYILTKQYPISNSSQILANMEMNRTQQDQINQNTSDISNIKKEFSDLNVMIESTEESLISGATGSEYGLALKNIENPLVTKIYGKTRRYSLNLFAFPDITQKINGLTITYTKSTGLMTVIGTYQEENQYTTIGVPIIYINSALQYTFAIDKPINKSIQISLLDTLGAAIPVGNTIKVFKPSSNAYSGISFDRGQFNNGEEVNLSFHLLLVEGTYTDETMPAFQPYDDTLVNSRCNLLSTGRNLISLIDKNESANGVTLSITNNTLNIKGTASVGSYFSIWEGEILLNGTYTFSLQNKSGSAAGSNGMYPTLWLFKDGAYERAIGLFTENTITITFDNYKLTKIGLGYSTSGQFSNFVANLMINYGDTALDFEPYKQDTMQIDVELGEYDYIDNETNLIVRQQSDVITLDGSSDENWNQYSTSNSLIFFGIKVSNPSDLSTLILNKNLQYKTTTELGNLTEYETCYSYANSVKEFRLMIDGVTSLEQLKTYLQSNPIQISYKLATPTTEPITLAAGYTVYPNGLQHQVVSEGKHLPYSKITKKYAISSRSQILHVIEINKDQQAEINELKNKNSSSGGSNLFVHSVSITAKNVPENTRLLFINNSNEQITIDNIVDMYTKSLQIILKITQDNIVEQGLITALGRSFEGIFFSTYAAVSQIFITSVNNDEISKY